MAVKSEKNDGSIVPRDCYPCLKISPDTGDIFLLRNWDIGTRVYSASVPTIVNPVGVLFESLDTREWELYTGSLTLSNE